jgi:predicted small lipoprotein YifL
MNRTFSIALIVLAFTVAGCGEKAPLEGRNDPYAPAQIHFAQKSLEKRTAVQAPTAMRDERGEILWVTIPIRSTVNKQLYVDHRVTWVDRYGQVISSTGWQTKTLPPNTPDRIQVNATNVRAADFQVDFRWAQ